MSLVVGLFVVFLVAFFKLFLHNLIAGGFFSFFPFFSYCYIPSASVVMALSLGLLILFWFDVHSLYCRNLIIFSSFCFILFGFLFFTLYDFSMVYFTTFCLFKFFLVAIWLFTAPQCGFWLFLCFILSWLIFVFRPLSLPPCLLPGCSLITTLCFCILEHT